jgi:hypothetical protein
VDAVNLDDRGFARGHIEFVQEEEIEPERRSYRDDVPALEVKVLSEDDVTGGFTHLALPREGWGFDETLRFLETQELFVLEGELVVDGRHIDDKCYVRLPEGVPVAGIRAETDASVVWMAEADLAGEGDPGHHFWAAPEDEITVVDSKEMVWDASLVPEGPEPGIRIKPLWHDDVTEASVHYIDIEPGWTESNMEHHDCVEESFKTDGDMRLGDTGVMRGGGYFWRPPWIHHGPMHTEEGTRSLIRTDSELVNYYTAPDGAPLNF